MADAAEAVEAPAAATEAPAAAEFVPPSLEVAQREGAHALYRAPSPGALTRARRAPAQRSSRVRCT